MDLKQQSESLFEKATLGFWNYVNSWRIEEPSEFYDAFKTKNVSLIFVEKEKICYVVSYRFDEPIEFIQTTLNVLCDDRQVAQYHFMLHLDGEVMDDVLSFEK